MGSVCWNEHLIAGEIARQTLARKCVVLVDNCSWTGHECDVLGVTTDLRIIDIEVKISRADLKADARKDKWWRHLSWQDAEARGIDTRTWNPWKHKEPREWPPKVWKHYYALPAETWCDDLIAALPSPKSGVLLLKEQAAGGAPVVVECRRRATPNKDATRLQLGQVMDIARLANLRMWDAYRNSERLQKDVAYWREQSKAAA